MTADIPAGIPQLASAEADTIEDPQAKAQQARNVAEGKKSLHELANEWRETATQEQLEEWKRKKSNSLKATNAAKRAKILEGLSGSERKKKQAEYDYRDSVNAKRDHKVDALLKLPRYAAIGRQWCYKNLMQAKNDGVVFFQDCNGEWHAQMPCAGAGMGSSS